jgi:hypothetical protein
MPIPMLLCYYVIDICRLTDTYTVMKKREEVENVEGQPDPAWARHEGVTPAGGGGVDTQGGVRAKSQLR